MTERVKPRILSGFMELLPEDQILFNRMKDTIRSVYERFGFLPLDTPTIELAPVLLAKAGGETEKQIYRFQKGDNDLALRFDLTVPLARFVAMHQSELVFPFKRYQIAKSYRGERPQKGRYREFYQCDIDVIGQGELSLFYDAEMPAVIYEVFRELNMPSFTVRMNNRRILNGFFRSIGCEDRITDILRTIDKMDKIGDDAVREELTEEGIRKDQIDKIEALIHISGSNDEILEQLKALGIQDETFLKGVDEMAYVIRNLRLLNVPEENFAIDLTIARGLDYYTGTVYETRLNDYPKLGSICSGGRYDNLTDYYTDSPMPGIGISIGLTRLFSQMKEAGLLPASCGTLLKALVIPMDSQQLAEAVTAASALRKNGINTDVYCQEKGMKQKMKYASRIGVPYVLLIGSEEAEKGQVSLKNMNDGTQQMMSVSDACARILENA